MLEPVNLIEAPDGTSFRYPYIATLSPNLKLGCDIITSVRSKIVKIVESAVEGIMQTEGVADSLINDSLLLIRSVRQIDIKNDDQKLVFKTFISWDKDKQFWQVFMEEANETYFEDKLKPIGNG